MNDLEFRILIEATQGCTALITMLEGALFDQALDRTTAINLADRLDYFRRLKSRLDEFPENQSVPTIFQERKMESHPLIAFNTYQDKIPEIALDIYKLYIGQGEYSEHHYARIADQSLASAEAIAQKLDRYLTERFYTGQ